MRYAILGDIHSNNEALRAVLADVERVGADRILCLGDIVGYGAEPGECIREIYTRRIDSVLGNHDSAVVGHTPLDWFNDYARAAVVWTAGRLSGEEKKYLSSLPLTGEYEGFTIVHSSLAAPAEWNYVTGIIEAMRCFECLTAPLCFVGHSHMPVIFRESGGITRHMEKAIRIEKNAHYIVNVGSVGQPRDGDPRAGYGLYDAGQMSVELRRVSYDVRKASAAIIAAGLPEFLALRLEKGY